MDEAQTELRRRVAEFCTEAQLDGLQGNDVQRQLGVAPHLLILATLVATEQQLRDATRGSAVMFSLEQRNNFARAQLWFHELSGAPGRPVLYHISPRLLLPSLPVSRTAEIRARAAEESLLAELDAERRSRQSHAPVSLKPGHKTHTRRATNSKNDALRGPSCALETVAKDEPAECSGSQVSAQLHADLGENGTVVLSEVQPHARLVDLQNAACESDIAPMPEVGFDDGTAHAAHQSSFKQNPTALCTSAIEAALTEQQHDYERRIKKAIQDTQERWEERLRDVQLRRHISDTKVEELEELVEALQKQMSTCICGAKDATLELPSARSFREYSSSKILGPLRVRLEEHVRDS